MEGEKKLQYPYPLILKVYMEKSELPKMYVFL